MHCFLMLSIIIWEYPWRTVGMCDDKLFRSQMRGLITYEINCLSHYQYFSFQRLLVTFQPFNLFSYLLYHTGIASDGLKGRVFEVSLADLQNDEVAFRKFKLITEDVQGKNCLTNFHGMDLTRDKMCSMVKKWQVMVTFFTSGAR